jgi:hypothetical protein
MYEAFRAFYADINLSNLTAVLRQNRYQFEVGF